MGDKQANTRQLKLHLGRLENIGAEIVSLIADKAPEMVAEMERLTKENEQLSKLREAMSYYAKETNYSVNRIDAQVAAQDFKPSPSAPVFEDRGRKARAALDAFNRCLSPYAQKQLDKAQ